MIRIQRAALVVFPVLILVAAVYPLCLAVGAMAGMDFALRSPPAYVALLAVLALTALWASSRESENHGKGVRCLVGGLLCLVDAVALAVGGGFSDPLASLLNIPLLLAALGLLRRAAGPRKALEALNTALVCVLIALTLAATLLSSVFADFGSERTAEYPSPEGAYLIQIREVNEGALGGCTQAYCFHSGEGLDLLIGRFTPRPIKLAQTGWGLFDEMVPEWISAKEFTLLGEAYRVP